jgi:glycosyltransferase involved in cell wall biosynthesis
MILEVDDPSRRGTRPLVSVVIPVYNQAGYLPGSIDSVLGQAYRPIELVVVDDGSTDDTAQVIASYGDRLTAMRQPNRGAANALNRGIRESRGALVCWLSADDEFLPGKIDAQVAEFEADPELGFCCTGFDIVDAAGVVIRRVPAPAWPHPDPLVAVFWRNPINGSTAMLRREVFEAVGPFNETLRVDVDAEMWLRIARQHRIRQIDRSLLRYRVHGQALSADRPLMRSTMTEVRLRALADGSLAARLVDDPTARPGDLFAVMSAEYAWRGMRELADALLQRSNDAGGSRRRRVLARAVLVATAWPRLHFAVRRAAGRVRRALWRMQVSRRGDP